MLNTTTCKCSLENIKFIFSYCFRTICQTVYLYQLKWISLTVTAQEYVLISVIKHFAATITALYTAIHSSGKETLKSQCSTFLNFIYIHCIFVSILYYRKSEYSFILHADWDFHTILKWHYYSESKTCQFGDNYLFCCFAFGFTKGFCLFVFCFCCPVSLKRCCLAPFSTKSQCATVENLQHWQRKRVWQGAGVQM